MEDMLRRLLPFLGLVWLVACNGFSTGVSEIPSSTTAVTEAPAEITSSVPTLVVTPSPVQIDTPTANVPPTNTVSPTALPTIMPSPVPFDLSITADEVFLYPVPAIYAGDLVTFQVLAHVPDNVNSDEVTVHVLVDYQDVAEGTLSRPNLAGDAIGLFEWAWDTTGESGDHLIHVILDRYDDIQVGDEDRNNNQVAIPVAVNDPEALPARIRQATWVTTETACCQVHVVSGTAAYRDLSDLLTIVETAVQQTADKLDEPLAQQLDVYLVDRVIGQGGYAGNSIVVSYLDRHYASNGFHEVLVHEATHLLDRQFAPERIAFLAEGLAVWASGGHYKAENIKQRSAALVTIGRYVPLAELIDNFYPVQHEVGYLEAAGLVTYLIDMHGWVQFREFYSDVTAEDGKSLSEAMDVNLRQYFGVSLAELEADWLAYLSTLPVDRMTVVDLQTTIHFFDTMRRYQQYYDPTAFFLTAWLPYPKVLQEEGNPADLTRHPAEEINVTLEVMLQAADHALRDGDYERTNILLDSIWRVLDNGGTFIDPLSRHYLEVVRTATAEGYEVQQVDLHGDRAVIWVTRADSAVLSQLNLRLSGQDWILLD
jgi:hypothetical protein